MRKFLFILSFLFMSVISKSQTEFNFDPSNYGDFKVSGQAQCGYGNAYCMVQRSVTPNIYNNYIYTIYFSTNSYLGNCTPVRTYIQDIQIYYYDEVSGRYLLPMNYNIFWVTVGQTSLAYTLFHPSQFLKIKVRTGIMQPTIY